MIKAIVVVLAVVCFYFLGLMTGYAVGYNDKYTEVVAKWRIHGKRSTGR